MIACNKRMFHKFTEKQVRIMEKAYRDNPYPDCLTKNKLSEEFEIDRNTISNWFQTKRSKQRMSSTHHGEIRSFCV